jgi:hypothetical protein
MVVVIQRMIQKVVNGQDLDQWEKLDAIDKKYNEIEKKLGFPDNKKRYRCLFGTHDSNTIIIEFQWPSMGKYERIMTKAILNPEYIELSKELIGIIESQVTEIYTPHVSLSDFQKALD